MGIREKIQSVLDSDLSGYKLMKQYEINDTKVSRLRNGKNSLDDLTLVMIERFLRAYDTELNQQEN